MTGKEMPRNLVALAHIRTWSVINRSKTPPTQPFQIIPERDKSRDATAGWDGGGGDSHGNVSRNNKVALSKRNCVN